MAMNMGRMTWKYTWRTSETVVGRRTKDRQLVAEKVGVASRGETKNEKNAKKMTWEKNAKRRLYTDDIVLNCGLFFKCGCFEQ